MPRAKHRHAHTDTLKYTNADEIIKQGPPIATRNPSAHPALTVDSPPHLSLVIAKKQGTICHSVCKCDHPLCHLKHTHTGVDAHLHEQPYACTQTQAHARMRQTQFPSRSQRQRQTAIPLSKRFSDDESERFLPLIFDVQRGCDQRGLPRIAILLSLSQHYAVCLCTFPPPPAVTENTHTRQEQTVSICLLILDLLVWLAGGMVTFSSCVNRVNPDFFLYPFSVNLFLFCFVFIGEMGLFICQPF